MPTEKAHGAQIMKTCEALARGGAAVELVVPARKSPIKEDPFFYYGAQNNFVIKYLPVLDVLWLGRAGFWIESLSFSIFAFAHALGAPADMLYSRDELPLWMLSWFTKKIVWESHTGRNNFLTGRLVAAGRRCVVISQGLKDAYQKSGAKAQMLVAHDGVDLEAFAHPQERQAACARLALPEGKKITMYIGRLDGWKGVTTLFEASKLLPQEYLVAIIGGEASQVEKLASAYPEVLFLGTRPYKELADNQAAADILVLPNTAKDTISAQFTSPMKLFSYMASGKPIVASDLPSIREVLSEKNAVLFAPDNAHSLAEAIRRAAQEDAGHLAQQAKADVEAYSWDVRARRICSFIAE